MGDLGFALALDAGTTSVTAVIACPSASGMQLAQFALGGEQAVTGAVACVTDDGDVLFGGEAERIGKSHPERLVRNFVRAIGDQVPIVVGGYAISADEIFARMVLAFASAAAAERGALPDIIAIVHSGGWHGHRVDGVRRHLREVGLHDVLLVPSAIAVAQHLASESSRRRTVGVFDLGGRSFEASVLRGTSLLGEPVRAEVGGHDIDSALIQQVLSLTGRDLSAIRTGATADVADDSRSELDSAHRAIISAKEALSFNADTSIRVTLDHDPSNVRLTRSELETLASPIIAETIDAMERAMEAARVIPGDLDEIIVIGGSARLPLVAQSLSDRLNRPLTVPADPQFAAALGGANIAWTQLQKRHPMTTAPVPSAEAHSAPATQHRHSSLPRRRTGSAPTTRARLPYAAAAALVASAVLIAAGIVFASSTPLGTGADASERTLPDEGASSSSPMRLVRSASDYSAAAWPISTGSAELVSSDADASAPSRQRGDAESAPRMSRPPADEVATPAPRRGGPALAPPDADESAGRTAPSPRPRVPSPASAPVPAPAPDPAPSPDPIPDSASAGPAAAPPTATEPVPVPVPATGPAPATDAAPAPATEPDPEPSQPASNAPVPEAPDQDASPTSADPPSEPTAP